MSYFWWVLFFVVVAFMMLFLPFSLRIKFHNVRDDTTVVMVLNFMLFRRLCLYTFRRSMGKQREDVEDDILRKLLKQFFLSEKSLPRGKQVQIVSSYMMRVGAALNWHEIMVLLRIGTGDAASTGINIGLLRSLCGIISHMLQKKWRFIEKDPLFLTYPYFLERKIKFYITAECSTGLGQFLYRFICPVKITRR